MTATIDRDVLDTEVRRAAPVTTGDELLGVLRRAARASVDLPQAAVELFAKAGVNSELLNPEVIEKSQVEVKLAEIATNELAQLDAISTKEAAKLLGMADANVRRAISHELIYSAGRDSRGGHRLPVWQFSGGRPLPHLREVVAELPSDLHPYEVTSFFTTKSNTLNDRTPADWLATGGSEKPILALAAAEARL
jgi:hypothetical protein